MTYKFAPGCKITPEVGYIANQDSYTTGNSAVGMTGMPVCSGGSTSNPCKPIQTA